MHCWLDEHRLRCEPKPRRSIARDGCGRSWELSHWVMYLGVSSVTPGGLGIVFTNKTDGVAGLAVKHSPTGD